MSFKKIKQQSDIIIDSNGKINISFLWNDLIDLVDKNNVVENKPNLTWEISSDSIKHFSNYNEYNQCHLCPKECGFDRVRNVHPTCGDAELRVSNYGVSFGDENEIKGTNGSGVIMLSGCPLTCISCHNPEKVAMGEIVSSTDFLTICKSLLESNASNIQILSPTVHLPKLRVVLSELKKSHFPLPIILKSSGYESISELKKLKGLVDVYFPDFKFGPCSEWGRKAGVKNYFEIARSVIAEMYEQVGSTQFDENGLLTRGVLIRHVEAPLAEKEKNELFKFFNSLPKDITISIQNNFVHLE